MAKIIVNGEKRDIDAEDDMPLLWAIRDIVGLTGTKFGCGKGLCGACTVHVDGVATRSCITPLGLVKDKSITTIEGLSDGENYHPVQQAWVEEDVPQCGYCQSGQIMSAAAFLQNNPAPSDEEIRQGMTNLCRCGTYQRIFGAIKKASQKETEVNS